MKTPTDLFLMRKQFTLQMASVTFITYVACLQQRTLPRFQFSRTTGMIYMSELLPCTSLELSLRHLRTLTSPLDFLAFSHLQPDGERACLLGNDDPVDFRLTPNLQHFMTPTGIEGILTASLVAIARGLCPPEVRTLVHSSPSLRNAVMLTVASSPPQFDLEEQLSLFIKDEVYHMSNVLHRRPLDDLSFRQLIADNVAVITNRVQVMSCQYERERVSSNDCLPRLETSC